MKRFLEIYEFYISHFELLYHLELYYSRRQLVK